MGCGASTPGNGQGMTPVLEAKQEQDGKPAEPSRSNGTGAVQQAAEPEAPETEQPELQQPSSGPRQDPACLADVRRIASTAPAAVGNMLALWRPIGTCVPVPADIQCDMFCKRTLAWTQTL